MIGNYYDLTIKQFLRIKTITELETDPLQRSIRMIAEVTGKTVDEIEEYTLDEIKEMAKKMADIETLQPTDKLKMKFKIGGKRFEYIWKTQELTAYQYIDATHFCKDPVNNIHNILASIVVERSVFGKRKPYNGNTHKERAELFYEQMKIKDAMPVMLFFCKYLGALSDLTQTFLISQVSQLKEMANQYNNQDLTVSGDG